jgi:pyridoxine 5'-phosphate synthase PdxJ
LLLGVNIDHIAVLREARKINDPNPLDALGICKLAGGTVDDVESFKNEMGRTLQANKEMGHRNQSYILGVNNILEPQATPQSEVQ